MAALMAGLEKDQRIAVIGAGALGAGVVKLIVSAGYTVLWYDDNHARYEKAEKMLRYGFDRLVERGRLQAAQRDIILQCLQPLAQLSDLQSAKMVIYAVESSLSCFEKEALLEQTQLALQKFETYCSPQAILVSTNPHLSPSRLSTALEHPQRLLGMNFFQFASTVRVIEVFTGLMANSTSAALALDTASNWGKPVVQLLYIPGLLVQRLSFAFYAEALKLLEVSGADLVTLDTLLRDSGGLRSGVFEQLDKFGIDHYYLQQQCLHVDYAYHPRFAPSLALREWLDMGCLGVKAGEGFYSYQTDAVKPNPALAPSQPAPTRITLLGDAPFAADLLSLLNTAGLTFDHELGENPAELVILAGEAVLSLSDGRTATQSVLDDDTADLVLFDLAFDYVKAPVIGLAAADQTSAQAVQDAIGFWQALGKQVIIMDDSPGLCVMRCLCLLINESSQLVQQKIATAAMVDLAVQQGMQLPLSPFHWAQTLGIPRVVNVLNNLAESCAESYYRASPLLLRYAASGRKLL